MRERTDSTKMFKVLLMIFAVLFTTILVVSHPLNASAMESRANGRGPVYTSVRLTEEDTFESLAEKYAAPISDKEAYINEIVRMNNMPGEKLHPGCYVMVASY